MDSLSPSELTDSDVDADQETADVVDALVGLSGLEHPEFAEVLAKGSCPSDAAFAIKNLLKEAAYLRKTLASAYKQIADLENLADRDWLVSALNRRAFMKALCRAISFGHRYGTENCVLYLDINGMKAINDTHGHAAGDAALIHIASILNDEVRKSDVVGRLGGDEFAVLLAQTDLKTAKVKGRALVDAIRTQPILWEGSAVVLEAACGAHQIVDGNTAETVLELADRAMYADKRAAHRSQADQ